MAIRFIDGFDHYATGDLAGKWAFVGRSGSWSLTTGRFGGQSLTGTNNDGGQYIYRDLGASYPTGVIGFAFKSLIPTSALGFLYPSSGATGQFSITINSDGTLSFTSLTSTTAAPFALSPSTWYYLELKYSVASSIAANSCAIYINGSLYLTATSGQATNGAGGTTMNRIIFNNGSTFNGQCYYDDLYFLDIDGDTTGPLGECRVDALLPTGAGTTSAWTPLSGSNYSQVDQSTPDGDTTYVSSSTVGALDTYVMGDLSTTPTTVHAVQSNIWSRKENTAARLVAPGFRIGGTNYTGTGQALLSGYQDLIHVFRTSPATSAAWTASEINGMEAGISLSA